MGSSLFEYWSATFNRQPPSYEREFAAEYDQAAISIPWGPLSLATLESIIALVHHTRAPVPSLDG
eukprot:9699186-Prorocentrum_lima.AAC.1